MKKCFLSLALMALLLVLPSGNAFAQAYTFNISEENVNVFWNEDGSASLDYIITFNNDPGAHAIDFVDLGLPNSSFVDGSITADVNGAKVTDISRSGFQGTGPGVVAGVAVGLGSQTIPPGGKGTLHVNVGKVNNMLQRNSQQGYASAVFSPAWFMTAHGETNLTVVFHFLKSVGNKDASWHTSQPGWADQPKAGVDDQGLLTYTWNNPKAAMNQKIDFGASFPSTLFPAVTASLPTATVIHRPTATYVHVSAPATTRNQSIYQMCCTIFPIVLLLLVFAVLIGYLFVKHYIQRSQTEYTPPKISVEGYSIKRGLTAVEAAVVLEEPVDKILTMILFSVVKKGAAQVITNDPLDIKVVDPPPEGLTPYEKQFLYAFKKYSNGQLRDALEEVMTSLFGNVGRGLEGFNRQQTVDYYRNVVRDAWAQVEAADTPEVTSQKFEENMDWTMLDHEHAPRTQRLFENKRVYLPAWWSHYDPTVHLPSADLSLTPTVSAPAMPAVGGTAGGKISPPVLPGADFAASIVRSTQNFSRRFIGDINIFTQNVKSKSAPPPRPVATPSSQGGFSGGGGGYHPHPSGSGFHTHHSGGGGHHCACACAGGGR